MMDIQLKKIVDLYNGEISVSTLTYAISNYTGKTALRYDAVVGGALSLRESNELTTKKLSITLGLLDPTRESIVLSGAENAS